METSQTVLQQEAYAQSAVDLMLLLCDDVLLDDAKIPLQADARILQLLPLVNLGATTTFGPVFKSQLMVAACVTVGAETRTNWLVGVSKDRYYFVQLDTPRDAAAVQLIGFLKERVVFACGTWLGTVSSLYAEALSSLEYQPHRCSAITHLLTAWSMIPDARVGIAKQITRVSLEVLLGLTCHNRSTAASIADTATTAAPKLAWACQGCSGASVWSTTLQVYTALTAAHCFCQHCTSSMVSYV
eukprot:8164-Heterococcus_DN1.PRE.16